MRVEFDCRLLRRVPCLFRSCEKSSWITLQCLMKILKFSVSGKIAFDLLNDSWRMETEKRVNQRLLIAVEVREKWHIYENR